MFTHFLRNRNSSKWFRSRVTGILILSLIATYSQESNKGAFKYEIELGTDNDFLVVNTSTDKYYTYGINASFRWRLDKPNFISKLFSNRTGYFESLGFNMEGYTPDYQSSKNETERPYAGWSYFEFQSTYGFKKSFLRLGIDVGILGPDSQVGAVQNWFHGHVTGDRVLDGWKYQINNQLGVNLRVLYAVSFYQNKIFDFYGATDISLGNIFTYINPGINFRIGKFNSLSNSAAYQNAILANNSNREFFLDGGIAVKMSAFNATIQGNKIDEFNFIDSEIINNVYFNGQIGMYYGSNRWTLGAKYFFSSGELNDNDSQRYAMLTFSYKFD
ncbi:lipid A deacylase LpxR family protein [uncultured Aquimarina sp.]|uniref:lipid A deacylase LpxR family protein n=1 Tax=uncultured Aquimarina sp. TaxID=575652 RepID=UPI0026138D13|nr:lipid A deacylase LpxR family protein [uncultured Aquimarina sp.]